MSHELDQILETANAEKDGELAKELSSLELTERLKTNLLLALEESLRGKKSIAALVVLAISLHSWTLPQQRFFRPGTRFLDTQRQMISRTVRSYSNEVIPKLPDFFALRTTTEYEQPSLQKADTWKTAPADQSFGRGGRNEKTISAIGTAMRTGCREEGG